MNEQIEQPERDINVYINCSQYQHEGDMASFPPVGLPVASILGMGYRALAFALPLKRSTIMEAIPAEKESGDCYLRMYPSSNQRFATPTDKFSVNLDSECRTKNRMHLTKSDFQSGAVAYWGVNCHSPQITKLSRARWAHCLRKRDAH
jgi:hypothetical protein